MKRNRLVGPLILITMAAMVIQAVQATEEPVELKNDTVKIQEIVKNESAFDNKYVVIDGKIDSECASGCWFIVDDETHSCISISTQAILLFPRREDRMSRFMEK